MFEMFEEKGLTKGQVTAVFTTARLIVDDMKATAKGIAWGKQDNSLYDVIEGIDVIKSLLKPFLVNKRGGITYDNIRTVDRHLRDAVLYADAYKVMSCCEVLQEWIMSLTDIIEKK